MKYYLIAGEASGDLHASNLMAALKKDPEATFRFFGGDLMQAVGGVPPVRHYRETAYMGVIPVLLHLPAIWRNMRVCRRDIREFQPDVVVTVDYPGFNLRIARYVKTRLHIPVYYYISPKIWAWKKYRIRSLRRYVDRLFCILPFEVGFFRSLNYRVDYVGNPSVDAVCAFREERSNRPDTFREDNGLTDDRPVIALLAGSRKAEIRQNLATMLEVAGQFTGYQPVVAGAPGLTADDYRQASGGAPAKIVYGQTYDLLAHAAVALVTSGTATLEAALFRVPQVVCYRIGGGRLINFVFERFFHVPYISLVNLIAGREVVPELFGANFSVRNISEALRRIVVDDDACRRNMLEGYDRVIALLGAAGASARAAERMTACLSTRQGSKL